MIRNTKLAKQFKSQNLDTTYLSAPLFFCSFSFPFSSFSLKHVLAFVCLGFVMSSVCYILCFLGVAFFMSIICYALCQSVQGLLCLVFVMSSICYVLCLLCFVLVCLGFVMFDFVMSCICYVSCQSVQGLFLWDWLWHLPITHRQQIWCPLT